MRRHSFLAVVPRAVRVAALVVGCCVVLAGLVAAFLSGRDVATVLLYSAAAVVLGVVVTTWLLGVGFVYADARRRGMRPRLWAILVILFPHLLGFLLYFVLRQPLAATCSQCGQAVSSTQRFCSWCGASQAAGQGSTATPTQAWTRE